MAEIKVSVGIVISSESQRSLQRTWVVGSAPFPLAVGWRALFSG